MAVPRHRDTEAGKQKDQTSDLSKNRCSIGLDAISICGGIPRFMSEVTTAIHENSTQLAMPINGATTTKMRNTSRKLWR
jgi:hypothetical protein